MGIVRLPRAAVAAGLAWAAAAAALETDPPWRRSEFRERAVFEPAASPAAALIELPASAFPAGAALAAAGPSGRALGAREVFRNADRVWVLVPRETPAETRPHELYWGEVPTDSPPSAVRDPRPVRLDLWQPIGSNVPDSWPRMANVLTQAGAAQETVFLTEFRQITQTGRFFPAPAPDRPRRGAGYRLFRLSAWAIFPETGAFRFALDANAAAHLWVDGRLAASAPPGAASGVWSEGDPLEMTAGVRFVELFVAAQAPPAIRIGWRPPGATRPQPFSEDRLAAATRANRVRVERRDRTIHPDFDAILEGPYRFNERHDYFQPVRFIHRTVNRLTENLAARWRFDDGETLAGDVARKVFRRRGPWRATLEVRDRLGFTASLEREIEPPRSVPRLYTLHAALVRCPPVAFPADRLAPDLTIEGRMTPDLRFTADWTWTPRDGEPRAESREFAAGELPLRFPIGRASAGAVETLEWRVTHEGEVLFSETIRIGPAPAEQLRVEGDALYDGAGLRRVLLTRDRPAGPGQPPLDLEAIFGQVLFVDDTLAPAGPGVSPRDDAWHRQVARLLDGPDRPRVRLLRPPDAGRAPEAWPPLLKFQLDARAAFRRPTLTLISIARSDLLERLDVETFERQAAALTDALRETTGAPAAWLTPPPFPELPGARDYAAAIQRVARARGMPVADLYTAFIGAGAGVEPARFFRPGAVELTAEGRELAARATARALLVAAGETP